MKALPLTEVGMFSPFASFLDEKGMPANRLLDENNVSREMVDRGLGKVTKMQFYQFLAAAGRNDGLRDLGYRIGEVHGMRFIGPVGKSVLRAATLKDAVDTFAVHLSGWLDENYLWLEQDGRNVWLCNVARDGLADFQAVSNQCAIMTLVALVREVAGRDWRPKKIRLDVNASTVYRDVDALADAEVETIQHGVAIQFPEKFLSRAIQNSIEGGPAVDPLCAGPDRFTSAFEATLRDQLPFVGVPTVFRAAEIAGTSTRTLQRQLGSDGLTYQRLVDRIRFQAARDRLREDPNVTVRQLAAELYYSSPSSFVRSFRRIAGVTPGVFACEPGQIDGDSD